MYNPNLHFHFVGIGGSGMSGLAEILLTLGFKVSGSDVKPSQICAHLESLGAKVCIGHSKEHLPPEASLLVYSSAVNAVNPEVREARRRGLPVVRRAEVLAELMRLKYGVGVAGSHGKTTTTSMCSAIMDAGGLDPTVVIGGQVKSLGSSGSRPQVSGTGGKLGKSDFLVAETDESDRSFLLLKPTVAIVTNIDNEHLNAYRSWSDLERSFQRFVDSVPFYGLTVLCVDDPHVARMARKRMRKKNGRVTTYGFDPSATVRGFDVAASRNGMEFSVTVNNVDQGRFSLPMLGRHLVQNALAAIAVGLEFGIPVDVIRRALSKFEGVKRRLEVVGERDGVIVMTDYGHHPTEIRATLRAIRDCYSTSISRFHVVFQPHRYSRTKLCWDDFRTAFTDADSLHVTEIYAASEDPLPGIDGSSLVENIVHANKCFEVDIDHCLQQLASSRQNGDLVLFLGAGSVGSLPEKFLDLLDGTKDGKQPLTVVRTKINAAEGNGTARYEEENSEHSGVEHHTPSSR